MEIYSTEIALLIVSAIIALIYFKNKRPKDIPPGPSKLPIIGNFHQLSDEPAKDFIKWANTYGDIFSFQFGSFPAVILNSPSIIKEAFAESSTSGRPKFEIFIQRSGGKPRGIIFHDGPDWVEQRRFVLKNLRDFGFGKKSMEVLVHEEITELIEGFKKDMHSPISTQNRFNAAVLNALWSIITGQRYGHNDPILEDLIKKLTSGLQQTRVFSAGLFFPFLRKILPDFLFGGMKLSKRREDTLKTLQFMKDAIKDHLSSFQQNSPRDFIDVYLEEIKKTKNESSSFYGEEGEKSLMIVMLDLFVAGAETTSTTLVWTFLLLALHLDIQEKLFKEIKKVVGLSRLPSLSDRPLMPFTEAVIMEVMRYSALAPLAVQHRATEDMILSGYRIPMDTLIIPNLYAVHHDKNIWGDPESFRPERFLSSDETKILRHEAFLPFSTGKRVCLGEALARDELFLFTSSLFQRFCVAPDSNGPPLKIEYYTAAALLIPKPHLLKLTDRFDEKV